jgi:predicted GIY-YIG superfamily endonuclease
MVLSHPSGFIALPLLLLRLRDFRHSRASAERIPIYSVFGDTVLRSIAQDRPASIEALKAIRGFPSDKSAEYGPEILRLVRTTPPGTSAGGPASGPAVLLRHHHHQHGGGMRIPSTGLKRALLRKLSTAGRRAPTRPPPTSVKPAPSMGSSACPPVSEAEDRIYILELAGGRVYVGRTSCLDRRVSQHLAGRGSSFTQAFPPTGVLLPRLGRVSGSAEAAERDETLRYMFLRGVAMVRGWKYTRVEMSNEEEQDAEANIRELFDLCRRCGLPGHFVGQCRSGLDRFGRPVVS